MAGLNLQEAGPGNDEKDDPEQFPADAKRGMEEFCPAKAEKDDGEEIGGRANEKVTNTGDDGAKRADEILRRPVRRGEIAPWNPRREILGGVGDQGKKQERPNTEKDEGEDFIPGVVFYRSGHR